MKMIPAENARKFLSELENIFYTLEIDYATWHKFDTITDLYLGNNIRDVLQDDVTEEIAIIWNIEDVQNVNPNLTDNQASDVLKSLKKNHDANIGINWETIETVVNILFPSRSR